MFPEIPTTSHSIATCMIIYMYIDTYMYMYECMFMSLNIAEWFWAQATGSVPPPCGEISFIKTSDMKVVMVGGHKNSTLLEGVYQLNLKNWVSPNRLVFSAVVFV